MKRSLLCLLLAGLAGILPASTLNVAPALPQKLPDGLIVQPGSGGFLKIQVKADDIIRITFSNQPDFKADPMVVVGPNPNPAPQWALGNPSPTTATLTTAKLKVTVDLANGAVTFADPSGQTILAEVAGGRRARGRRGHGRKNIPPPATMAGQRR